MSAYTKGPLLVKVFAPTIGEHHDFHVCTEHEECIATFWGQDEVAEANAKLFAAAPELLEALKPAYSAILGINEDGTRRSGSLIAFSDDEREVIAAAIAKAEGR